LSMNVGQPVDTLVRQLNDWQPQLLVTYATLARILAGEQLAGRLRISPDMIFTSAEVLTDETRRRVEQVWGKRLFNQYAATETGVLRVLLSGVQESLEGEKLADALRRELAAQGAVVPPVRVQRVPTIPRGAAGKTPLVRSNMPRPAMNEP
jgi:phenylacetate-coenzyme A ligase PaaK-like adenylate-forming protein